jgi:RimJ/RimL family protein N-acetyltransferase
MFTRETIDDGFVIETERLLLRWPRLSDGGAIERLAGDRAVAEMTALIPHPYPAGAAAAFILAARLANAGGTGLTLAITNRRKPRELLGAIALHGVQSGAAATEPLAEPFLGFWLGSDHWGRGLATEAARAVVAAAFEHADAPAVTAEARSSNGASRHVLEKAGFRTYGTALSLFPARGGLFPVHRMRLTRKGWLTLRRGQADEAPQDALLVQAEMAG